MKTIRTIGKILLTLLSRALAWISENRALSLRAVLIALLMTGCLVTVSTIQKKQAAGAEDEQTQYVMTITVAPSPTPSPVPAVVDETVMARSGSLTMVNAYLAEKKAREAAGDAAAPSDTEGAAEGES